MDLGFEPFTLAHFMFSLKATVALMILVFGSCFAFLGASYLLDKTGFKALSVKAKEVSNGIWKAAFLFALATRRLFVGDKQ